MKIVVNGQTYDSWADVPAELRDTMGGVLPDTDGDGVPDLVEGHLPPGQTNVTATKITVNGQSYDSIDDVPADIRATLQGVFGGSAGQPPSAAPRHARPVGVPGTPAQPPAEAPAGAPQLSPGQVLLNGEVVNVDDQAKRKHWWQRG